MEWCIVILAPFLTTEEKAKLGKVSGMIASAGQANCPKTEAEDIFFNLKYINFVIPNI